MVSLASRVQDGPHRFSAALQSALTVDEVERAFLREAHCVLPAGAYGLYRLDPETGAVLGVAAEVPTDFLDEYEDYGRADDPVLDFVRQEGLPIDSSRVVPRSQWDCCGAREALAVGGQSHSLEAPLLVAGVLYGTVNFARPDEHGPFSDADLLAARHSSEQVALAVERGLRFELTGKRANVLEHALDRVPQPLVITDLSAEVIFRNRAALAADRAGADRAGADRSGAGRAGAGRSGAGRAGTNRAPGGRAGDGAGGASVREAVEGSIAEAMTEFRRDGKRVSTRSVRSQGQQMIVRSYRLPEQDHAAVTIVYPYQDGSARRLPVWEVLTPREQEIAQLISHGLTTRQIAERAFVSENTVKQHLKRVFAKTDVRNRAELMQRIWSSGDRADGGAQPDR